MTYDNYKERNKVFLPNELPKILTREIFVTYRIAGNDQGKIEIWDCDLSGKERILLHKQMVTVKIPMQKDMKKTVISALENEIQTIKSEAHMAVKELQERIDSLLAISYQPDDKVIEIYK